MDSRCEILALREDRSDKRMRKFQDDLDEVPVWPDGTPSKCTQLTRMLFIAEMRIFAGLPIALTFAPNEKFSQTIFAERGQVSRPPSPS